MYSTLRGSNHRMGLGTTGPSVTWIWAKTSLITSPSDAPALVSGSQWCSQSPGISVSSESMSSHPQRVCYFIFHNAVIWIQDCRSFWRRLGELQYKFLAVCQNLGVKEFRVFSHVSFRSFRTPFLSNQCLHFNNGLSTGMGAQLCCNSTFVLKCRSAFDSQQSQFCSYKR
jgi:hypothetical protein